MNVFKISGKKKRLLDLDVSKLDIPEIKRILVYTKTEVYAEVYTVNTVKTISTDEHSFEVEVVPKPLRILNLINSKTKNKFKLI